MTENEASELLRTVMDSRGIALTWWSYVLVVLTALLGAFLGAYMKRRGENYATKQDLADITKVTEEIRTTIATQAWQSQRWWDEKKAVYFDLIRIVSRISDGLFSILNDDFDSRTRQPRAGAASDAANRLMKELDEYLQFTGVARVVLSEDANAIIEGLGQEVKRLHDTAYSKGDVYTFFAELKVAFNDAYSRLIDAAKSDLKGDFRHVPRHVQSRIDDDA